MRDVWCTHKKFKLTLSKSGTLLTSIFLLNFQIKLTCICPYIVDTGLCKNPKIKFPSLLKILTPQEAVENIVDAVRRNYQEITIPSSLYYINTVRKTFISITEFILLCVFLGICLLWMCACGGGIHTTFEVLVLMKWLQKKEEVLNLTEFLCVLPGYADLD